MLSTRPTAEHQHLCDTIRYSRDLISARFTIDALNRQLAIQNREKSVSVSATAGISYAEDSDHSRSSQSNLNVHIPLDNKSKNNAITQTKLQLSSAQQQFIQSCNELIREEHDQFQNMIHHYNTAKLAEKKLTLSHTINQASKIKFKHGAISATDVQQNHQLYLDAINTFRQAENQYTSSVEYYHKINNIYLNKLHIDLPNELNMIFQTIGQIPKQREIITARFAIDCTNLRKQSPQAICHRLLSAPIESY